MVSDKDPTNRQQWHFYRRRRCKTVGKSLDKEDSSNPHSTVADLYSQISIEIRAVKKCPDKEISERGLIVIVFFSSFISELISYIINTYLPVVSAHHSYQK